jgi:hypothetical protein
MANKLEAHIARAKELLQTVQHATMATVNEDGSPHNTPFYFLHDTALEYIYWGSHPNSLHSQNVLRTGQIFVVVYDAYKRGGLYIKADNGHPLEGKELEKSLAVHNQFRAKENKAPLPLTYYSNTNPQRMWSAKTKAFWVNGALRDKDGRTSEDIRQEISRKDLLKD